MAKPIPEVPPVMIISFPFKSGNLSRYFYTHVAVRYYIIFLIKRANDYAISLFFVKLKKDLIVKYSLFMKSKIKLISLVALAALTLTACDFIFPNISNSGGYSYLPIWDGEAQKADATISDYITNSIYCFSSAPSEGEAKLLVIPVWFDESDKYIVPAKEKNVRRYLYGLLARNNKQVGKV